MRYEGTEVFFGRDDLIVSKTDMKGRITYANHTFLDIAGYEEDEVIGQPHNVIRHANMPRGVFELFWEKISKEQEVFAYVVNATKSGGHYWVIAHVTPSYDAGEVVGFHSTRRVPNRKIIETVIEPLYDELNQIESRSHNRKDGIAASYARLMEVAGEKAFGYDQFISSLMWEN